MRPNLMGFKKSPTPIPPVGIDTHKGASIYRPLINAVIKTGETYCLDVCDHKRATHLSSTLRTVIKKAGLINKVKVVQRWTTVYVTPVGGDE